MPDKDNIMTAGELADSASIAKTADVVLGLERGQDDEDKYDIMIIPDVLRVSPTKYDNGIVGCREEEATMWHISHYQTNVPSYGSGWFPAYLHVPRFPDDPKRAHHTDFKAQHRTKEAALAHAERYKREKGL